MQRITLMSEQRAQGLPVPNYSVLSEGSKSGCKWYTLYAPGCCVREEGLPENELSDELLDNDPSLKKTKAASFKDLLQTTSSDGEILESWVATKIAKLPKSAMSAVEDFLSQLREDIELFFKMAKNTTGCLNITMKGESEEILSVWASLEYSEGGWEELEESYLKENFFGKGIVEESICLVNSVNAVLELFSGIDVETVQIYMMGDIWVDFSVKENLSRYDYFIGICRDVESGMYKVGLFMAPSDNPLVTKIDFYYSELIRCLGEEEYEEGEDNRERLSCYPKDFWVSANDTVEDIKKREWKYFKEV